ncbi:MAG: iron ABC transporter substrate-binding protein [Rhodobacteraceae bacterium]|nr:iron ABC transporter substrate-binding protein [Paracoccaceae bacterium]
MQRCKSIDRPVTLRELIVSALLAIVMALAFVQEARAREIVDATGRTVTIPDTPTRVFAAGPPASVLLYALAPETMVGWVRAPRESDMPFLLPSTHDLPELGRLTGQGGTVNLEVLLAAKPDLIVDFGTVNPTYIDLANRVTEQTGIPYILIDGSFANTPAAIRAMAEVLGVPERGEALASYAEQALARVDAVLAEVPEEDRPHVYLARSPEGLEAPARGSINAEIVERVGAVNVVEAETQGLVTTSLEQIIGWAPDTIITIDQGFAAQVGSESDWQSVPAVANGRVFLAPASPFGWIDAPPSVNRLIGLTWLLHRLYPDHVEGDLRAEVREFHRLFWQVEPDAAALDRLLGN